MKMASLKSLFGKKQEDDEKRVIFTTSLFERPDSRRMRKSYFCMAAELRQNDRWVVYRRRYYKSLGGAFESTEMPGSLFGADTVTVDEAFSRLQAFEKDHIGRDNRSNQQPPDAMDISRMQVFMDKLNMQAAQEAAAIAVKAVKLKHLRAG